MRVVLLSKKSFILVCVVVLLILAAIPAYYFYSQYQRSQQLLKDPTAAANVQVQQLIVQVSRLMELPQEQPTVATVSDKDKLKDQPFFAHAQIGDKVLIYPNTKKAILYRPSTNKIIEVASINIADQSANATPSASQSAALSVVKVAIYNGTQISGLASKIEPEVKKVLPEAQTTAKTNAASSDYANSMIVVLNDQARSQANSLAKGLNMSLQPLPAAEKRPDDADLLVIIGKDHS